MEKLNKLLNCDIHLLLVYLSVVGLISGIVIFLSAGLYAGLLTGLASLVICIIALFIKPSRHSVPSEMGLMIGFVYNFLYGFIVALLSYSTQIHLEDSVIIVIFNMVSLPIVYLFDKYDLLQLRPKKYPVAPARMLVK